MFNKIRQTKINDKTFQIYMLSASQGIPMAKRLAVAFLPTVGQFYEGVASGELDFQSLAMVLVSELENYDILEDIKVLLKELTVNGKEVDFDDYFMSNYGELVSILEYALKENFSSFFAVKGLFGKYFKAQEDTQES